MLPCEDVRKLIADHLAGTLDHQARRELTDHLKVCQSCHRAVEEARLADLVLRNAAKLPPPSDLAANIKSAVRARLFQRSRPLHERALGSPAFMATCASLLCGAIICLIAIWRVGNVGPVDNAPAAVTQVATPTLTAALPNLHHEAVALASRPARQPQLEVATQPIAYCGPQPGRMVDLPTATASAAETELAFVTPCQALAERQLPVSNAARTDAAAAVADIAPTPSRQRTSLPETPPQVADGAAPALSLIEPVHPKKPVDALPTVRLHLDAASAVAPLPTYPADYDRDLQ